MTSSIRPRMSLNPWIRPRGQGSDLADLLRKSADDYAQKVLARDELASKDSAMRNGLAMYLGIAARRIRGRLVETNSSERARSAIEAIVRAEKYLDANVNVAIVMEQLSARCENEISVRFHAAMAKSSCATSGDMRLRYRGQNAGHPSAEMPAFADAACDEFGPIVANHSQARLAIDTYSSADCAINSGKPTVLNRLTPTRETCVCPASVTTGTPIHMASQVVVVP